MSALPPESSGTAGGATCDAAGGKRKGRVKTHHTVAKAVAATMVVIALVTGLTVVFLYRHFNSNLTVQSIQGELGTDRPTAPAPKGPTGPINIMIMGSDNRD